MNSINRHHYNRSYKPKPPDNSAEAWNTIKLFGALFLGAARIAANIATMAIEAKSEKGNDNENSNV